MITPRISIILPTYNRCYILWRAVQSVVQQTSPYWELLIIDDGSTDQTARQIATFNDERIRYFKQENKGPSSARNFGVERVQANLIGYLDSDNFFYPPYVEHMVGALDQKPNKVFAFCAKNCIKKEIQWFPDEQRYRIVPVSKTLDHTKNISLEKLFRMEVGADTNTIVHRKEVWEKVGGWDESCRWLEDWDFNVRVGKAYPHGFLRVKQALVEYEQVHGESADGLCAMARENEDIEIRAREYLFQKYKDEPLFHQNTILLPENLRLKKVRSKSK